METLRRAVRNTLTQLGSQAITWSATLVFTAMLGRYLGDSGFGVLFLALSFTGIFRDVVEFGMQPLVTREVARREEAIPEFLLYGLIIKAVLWLLSFGAIAVSAALLDYSAVTRQVLTICTVTMGLGALAGLLSAIYKGRERLGPPSTATIVERLTTVILGAAVLIQGGGVVAIAWVLLAGAAGNLLWQCLFLRPYLRYRPALHLGPLRALVISAAPFALYWAVSTAYWKVDTLMLSKLADETVVGWYGAAYRLFETLLFLPTIVAAGVMMPVMSRLSNQSRDGMKLAFDKGLSVLLLAGIPICAGLLVLAEPVMLLIYGRAEFAAAAPAMQALAVGVIALYINAAAGWALLSLDMEKRLLPVPVVALIVNVCLNLYAIPRWGHTGAAVVTVITESLLACVYLAMLPRWLWPRQSLSVAVRATAAALIMTGVLLLTGALPVVARIVLGGVTYLVAAFLLGAAPRDDLRLLRQALGKRRPPPPDDEQAELEPAAPGRQGATSWIA